MVYSCITCSNAIYLRDFNTKLSKSNPETTWTVTLNINAHYRFNLCTPSDAEDKVILSLYDGQSSDEAKLLGSTYDKNTEKHYNSFDFHCHESGMYYVYIKLKCQTDKYGVEQPE